MLEVPQTNDVRSTRVVQAAASPTTIDASAAGAHKPLERLRAIGCLPVRVEDIDFSRNGILVRDGKRPLRRHPVPCSRLSSGYYEGQDDPWQLFQGDLYGH
jgi:hypothetical protein